MCCRFSIKILSKKAAQTLILGFFPFTLLIKSSSAQVNMGRTSGTALPFTNFLPIAPLKTSRQRHLDEMVKKMRQKENHGVTLQVSHFIRLKFFCLFQNTTCKV